MRPAARHLALLAAAAGLLGGCGAGSPLPVRNRTIGLTVDEYRIVPQRVSAPAGELRLIVRNRGILTHNVAVETIPDDPDAAPEVIARTQTVHGGDRAPEVRFTIKPGTYRLVCTISNHDDLGQVGDLVVR